MPQTRNTCRLAAAGVSEHAAAADSDRLVTAIRKRELPADELGPEEVLAATGTHVRTGPGLRTIAVERNPRNQTQDSIAAVQVVPDMWFPVFDLAVRLTDLVLIRAPVERGINFLIPVTVGLLEQRNQHRVTAVSMHGGTKHTSATAASMQGGIQHVDGAATSLNLEGRLTAAVFSAAISEKSNPASVFCTMSWHPHTPLSELELGHQDASLLGDTSLTDLRHPVPVCLRPVLTIGRQHCESVGPVVCDSAAAQIKGRDERIGQRAEASGREREAVEEVLGSRPAHAPAADGVEAVLAPTFSRVSTSTATKTPQALDRQKCTLVHQHIPLSRKPEACLRATRRTDISAGSDLDNGDLIDLQCAVGVGVDDVEESVGRAPCSPTTTLSTVSTPQCMSSSTCRVRPRAPVQPLPLLPQLTQRSTSLADVHAIASQRARMGAMNRE
eukprot:2611262-Rhodomonas_salina.1